MLAKDWGLWWTWEVAANGQEVSFRVTQMFCNQTVGTAVHFHKDTENQRVDFIVCELYFDNTIFIEKRFSVWVVHLFQRLVETMTASPRKMLTCPSCQNVCANLDGFRLSC